MKSAMYGLLIIVIVLVMENHAFCLSINYSLQSIFLDRINKYKKEDVLFFCRVRFLASNNSSNRIKKKKSIAAVL